MTPPIVIEKKEGSFTKLHFMNTCNTYYASISGNLMAQKPNIKIHLVLRYYRLLQFM